MYFLLQGLQKNTDYFYKKKPPIIHRQQQPSYMYSVHIMTPCNQN